MNVSELLEEAISDNALTKSRNSHNLRLILEMAQVAIPAVLRAGSGGNVHCKTPAETILKLQTKLKQK